MDTACTNCTRGTAKVFVAGTHRALHPDSTLRVLVPMLNAFGVTRVANITGLDYIGIPVAMSVRPNSYNLSAYQGKGLTLGAARVSAIMEAYEYACGERPNSSATWARTAALRKAAYILPRGLSHHVPLRTHTEIPWVTGIDLIAGKSILIPEEAITTDYRATRRSGFGIFRSTSNGLASGNTMHEAALHAMCELIERERTRTLEACSKGLPNKHPYQSAGSMDTSVHTLMDHFENAEMLVDIWEITSDIAVPAFLCHHRRRPWHTAVSWSLCRCGLPSECGYRDLPSAERGGAEPAHLHRWNEGRHRYR